ncbi:MAG: hypothetical protein ACLS5C_10070 [Waltera sp.]
MKPRYEVTEEDRKAMLEATTWRRPISAISRRRLFFRFVTEAQMPVTMIRLNLVKASLPLQIAEGWTVKLPEEVTDTLWKRTDYLTLHLVRTRCNGKRSFKSAYDVMNNWEPTTEPSATDM